MQRGHAPRRSPTQKPAFNNGLLKAAQPLPLKKHEAVRITIGPQRSWAERTAGIHQWTVDSEDLRRIVGDDEFGIRETR